jgi:hypothetical protein
VNLAVNLALANVPIVALALSPSAERHATGVRPSPYAKVERELREGGVPHVGTFDVGEVRFGHCAHMNWREIDDDDNSIITHSSPAAGEIQIKTVKFGETNRHGAVPSGNGRSTPWDGRSTPLRRPTGVAFNSIPTNNPTNTTRAIKRAQSPPLPPSSNGSQTHRRTQQPSMHERALAVEVYMQEVLAATSAAAAAAAGGGDAEQEESAGDIPVLV